MVGESAAVTFLFTDIEGSTRLWEESPARMRVALACHDALARAAVEQHRGTVVKTTGDGVHAAFACPDDALAAVVQMQLALSDPEATAGMGLRVRCGLHAGPHERRDADFYGPEVNRAARIMSAAHGGQILLSQAVAELVRDRLPADVALRDLGAVRLRDLSRPERVWQLDHARLPTEFPPLRSLAATPNNLWQQLNTFIGREREMAEAKRLLAGNRLLTLVGAGGIGKTRLSLQLAADVLDDYPDGVWFVDLAALTDPRLVAQALASVLGVKEEAGRPVVDALRKFVGDRAMLVLLDNCEHVLHACAELAKALLQSGPALRILASSREPLRVAGETVYPVPALTAPAPGAGLALEAVTRHDALRLFVDRARAAQPAFAVNERNVAAVVDICHRLDGIPLAIELAAARVRSIPVETIAARLKDSFRLLRTGDATVLPRQRTLRVLIDWSVDLLAETERRLLRRLSIFAGGWTLEAAESVGAGDGIDAGDVLELLSALVEKSLVVMDAEGERYRLLETVRQYAQERLQEAGEAVSVRDRHLAFYLAFAEAAQPELAGPEQGRWMARLDVDHENLLAAHAAADRAAGGAELGLRLVRALRRYWIHRGLGALGYRLTVEALARAGGPGHDLARYRGLFGAGQFAHSMGRYADAQRHLDQAAAIARGMGDTTLVAKVLQPLGLAGLGAGDFDLARRHLDEALDLARGLGDKRELLAASSALAQLHRMDGRLDTALLLSRDALALARELGDRLSVAMGLLNLAMVSIDCGSGKEARAMLSEVLAIVEEIGSKPAAQSALEVCAALAALGEDWETAACLFGAAEAQAAQTGLQRDPADAAFLRPRMARAQEALGAAGFAAAATAGRALADDEAMRRARASLLRRA
ncbi:MAG: tetratricopeptide repeat protein [Betaproteobacteria bacterium]|nr:tetratricopeptide repeat protein [Betaproteobacteria bacterium]